MTKTRKCEICKRKVKGIINIIFYPLKEVLYFPHILGVHFATCLECALSYQAQLFNSSIKDIEDYIKWMKDCEKYDK